jgi:N-methylhydantoinase B
MDGIHVHITNSRNLPTEVLENEFPLRVEQYGLSEGSGGAGRHRGGLGIVREVRALQDGTIFSARSDGHIEGSKGAEGGGDGGCGRLIRNAGRADEEVLASKVSNLVLSKGETVRIETPGGAGFGVATERSTEALCDDLRDGLLSIEISRQTYGVAATESALALLPRHDK